MSLLFSIVFAEVKSKMSFWQTPRKGANIFNKKIDPKDIKAAKDFGVGFFRLSPDKFLSQKRDFLIGNADQYQGLVQEDLKVLKNILDMCHKVGMPVVLSMLSLPGSRWTQNNNGIDDLRLWKSEEFQKQAINFWKDLAHALKDHPAIIGYNILNEPHTERLYDSKSTSLHNVNQEETQQLLFKFYGSVINAIRSVDDQTPIILDSSSYADPNTFRSLIPHKAKNILYSFHMYEPYAYTNFKMNKGRFCYPGIVSSELWDKAHLKQYMQPVIDFQKRCHVSSSHIIVGEFGGNRMTKGLDQYFRDLIEIFNEQGWHFAVYSFREDVWDGMDYELGDQKIPWKAFHEGKIAEYRIPNNPLFKVIKEGWK